MARYTEDQIADAAKVACFYVTPQGLWLRIQYCDMDAGNFSALDESSGEEYCFEFAKLVDEDVHFEHLVRTVIQ